MLILLVWGPCFENYSSDVPYSLACIPYTWPQGPSSSVYLSVLVHTCLYSWYTGLLRGHGTDQACSQLRVVACNVFAGCFKRPAPSALVQLLLADASLSCDQPRPAVTCIFLCQSPFIVFICLLSVSSLRPEERRLSHHCVPSVT